MTTISFENKYKEALNKMKGVMVAALKGVELPVKDQLQIKEEIMDNLKWYVLQNPLKKLTGAKTTNEEIESSLESCVPLIRECNEGYFVIVHGAPNGQIAVKLQDDIVMMDPEDDRFNFLFPKEAKNIYVISCYPGAKKSEWYTNNNLHFINIGDEMHPIGYYFNKENAEFTIGYVPRVHQEFIENAEISELLMKLKQMQAQAEQNAQ